MTTTDHWERKEKLDTLVTSSGESYNFDESKIVCPAIQLEIKDDVGEYFGREQLSMSDFP